MAAVLNNSDSSALRFNSRQDALDFAGHRVEHADRWLSSEELKRVERYKESKLHIAVINIRVSG